MIGADATGNSPDLDPDRRQPGVLLAHRLRNVSRVAWSGISLIFHALGRVTPRDPHLWVFGNHRSFADNSRYLLEYVVGNHPQIRVVWLARDLASRDLARQRGHESHLVTSVPGIYLAFRAGAGVVCAGLSDLNRAAVGGMMLTNLYHGTAFKRIGLDSPVTWTVASGPLGRWVNMLTRFLFRIWMKQIDLLPAPSPVVALHLESAFGLPPKKIIVAGTPRTDIILSSRESGCAAGTELKDRLGLAETARLILYAPTWREYSETGVLLRGFHRSAWDRVLSTHDAYMLVRLHPNMAADENLRSRLSGGRIVYPHSQVWPDVNRVLCAFDILLNDYSSIMFDYALLGRPIVFLAPDFHTFATARSFYEPYERISGGEHCEDWSEALACVEACLAGKGVAHEAAAHRICERYNAFHDTDNCRRIVDAMLAKLASR